METSAPCPCTSGETYGNCCGRYHGRFARQGQLTAPSPEALMRSRFTAFALGDRAYLLATWHPSTRPAVLELDPDIRWYRLDITEVTGGLFAQEGTVEFTAYYRSHSMSADGKRARGSQREVSRFCKEDGSWFYLDGQVG